jgi:mono/diheme cytochrome c family protein
MMGLPRLPIAATASALALAGVGLAALGQTNLRPLLPRDDIPPTAVSMLVRPIPDSAPNAAQLRKGRALLIAGDCMSCHLRPGGAPLSGGLGLNTPFGTIFSANITPDPDTGIGKWTADDFYRAVHDGHGAHGENLYPAFPYPWFRNAARADDDAIFAYLKTVPAVRYSAPGNKLLFPLNFRFVVKGWNLLFLRGEAATVDAKQPAEWNRGAYLVNGFAHCSACHTQKNLFGADKTGQAFRGGELQNWVAPDLTSNPQTGLGAWSIDEVAEYLKTGRNGRAAAGATMADVITYSTSLMTDADRHAMAVYLKSLPASPTRSASAAPDQAVMARGAAIYSDACASCHLENGVGQPHLFPPLGHDTGVQQTNPDSVLHLILGGTRIGSLHGHATPLAMPSFAWKLNDQEVADVATYVRNSWGNNAPAVSASRAAQMRKAVGLTANRYTANSGDQH